MSNVPSTEGPFMICVYKESQCVSPCLSGDDFLNGDFLFLLLFLNIPVSSNTNCLVYSTWISQASCGIRVTAAIEKQHFSTVGRWDV